MKTTYAPAGPREPAHDRCENGCRKADNETFACREKACPKDHLCEGCIWVCADCSEDFCEQHITDLMEVSDSPFQTFLCAACLANATPAIAS